MTKSLENKNVFRLRMLTLLALLAQSGLSLAAVNPITVTYNNGSTAFTNLATGSANYIVAVNAGVTPSNVALTFSVISTGASAGLTATQLTSGASPCTGAGTLCTSPFSLKAGERCCLAFSLASNQAGSYTMQPSIATTPPAYPAKASSPLNISVSTVIPLTTISVPATGVIPVNSAPAGFVVTNTGSDIAYNVQATLPVTWLPAVTQDATNCATISPGGTCTLYFSSTTPYVAQGNIQVTGMNISTPPATALAFTMSNYLVWSVTGAVAQVIAESDSGDPDGQIWSTAIDPIPGITELSVNGRDNGAINTGLIATFYGMPYTNYAAGFCYQITTDNSGGVPLGTWYMPAICQMSSVSAFCTPVIENINANLVQLGFGGLSGDYWSSTEASSNPSGLLAYFHNYVLGGGTNAITSKVQQLGVRCARAITF